jgi:predicted DNA-binding protein
MTRVAVSYKIDQEQDEKLKKLSERTGMSQAAIVRRALDEFFRRNDDLLSDQRPLFKD